MTLSRRSLVTAGAALAAFPLLRPFAARAADPKFATNPFTLGVASGYPEPNAIVLWTRLAPEPLVPGGGMPSAPVAVDWEIATTRRSSKSRAAARCTRRRTGRTRCTSKRRASSPRATTGIASRAAASGAPPAARAPRPRAARALATASRSRSRAASTTSSATTRRIARSRASALDLVVHVGDYIYEQRGVTRVRSHDAPEAYTLDDYRWRYALYKSDPDLQAAHAAQRLDGRRPTTTRSTTTTRATRRPTTSRASCSSRAARPRIRPTTSTCRCRAACFRAGRISSFIRSAASAGSSIFYMLDGRQYPLAARMRAGAARRAVPRALRSLAHDARRRAGDLVVPRARERAARGGTCWASRPCSRTSISAANRICVTPPTAGTATRRRALGSSTFSPSARSRIPSCSPATSTRSS